MNAVWCGRCRQHKTAEDFHRSSRNRSGRQSHCKQCQCAAVQSARQAHPAKKVEQDRAYRESNSELVRTRKKLDYRQNIIREKLRRGKNRAGIAGVPAREITEVELLADWERRGIDPERCVYTGELLQDGWHIDHAVPLSHPNTPGHVVTNLVPCNASANREKLRRSWIDYLADRAEAASAGAAVSAENQ